VDDEVIALLDEAVAVTPASPMLVKLLARLSVSHAYSPDRSLPVELSGRALELARRLDDADAMLHAVSARRASLLTPAGLPERSALDAELVDLARRADDGKEIDAHGFLAVDLLEAGRRSEADAEIDRYAELADRSHLPYHQWWAHVLRAVQALAAGDYEEGQRLADTALAEGSSADSPNAAFAWASQVFTVGRDTGRLRDLRDAIEPFADEYPDVPVWRAARAVQRAELGDREGAFADLEILLAADIREDSEWMVTHALMADVAWEIRHRGAAATLLERLRPFANRHVVVSVGVGYLGAVAHYLGLLAAVAEDWDAAEAWLRQAADAHAQSASPPWQARTQMALGMCLQRSGDRKDAAMDSFRTALELAEPIGMIAIARSARSLLGGDHRPTPAHNSLDALTASVTRDRPALASEPSLDGRLAVMFTDIEDYTAMTERLGDTAAQSVIQDHHAVVRKRVAEHGGFEVRSMGDGFMLTFPTPAQAVACAVSVQRELSERRSDPHAEPLKVRAGVHVGPVIEDDGDFYGRTVIIAARIANIATGEEVLVSSAVRKDLEGAFRFGPASAVHLKGLSGVYEICSVEWTD
jgi:class 3 adenylate cyclase